MNPGQFIVVYGRVNSDAKRFSVNLLRGARRIQEPGAEAALHLDFRFDEGQIVMNTMVQTLKWGEEERIPNPFRRGAEFHIIIRAYLNEFEILANHKKITDYKMRLPLNSIQYLTVYGDITVLGARLSADWPKRLPIRTSFDGGHFLIGEWFSGVFSFVFFCLGCIYRVAKNSFI
ncbi:unnamed protein product [Anisakis simplex]|uniref:Galectin n=1 Tax=Anisakis simplex TaxID=6269 RepID=A0A3P6NNM1_ANISI|nr:unnamed protein product [Anisakis simplex]